MNYFRELDEQPTHDSRALWFANNANSGGGNSFLAGRVIDDQGQVQPAAVLDGREATIIDERPGGLRVSLWDAYPVKPRAQGSPSMKLEVEDRPSPNRLFAAYLMMPEPCGPSHSADVRHSPLTLKNYWFDTVTFEVALQGTTQVDFCLQRMILGGGRSKKKTVVTGEARFFELDFNRRISDIVSLSRGQALPEDLQGSIDKFAEIYVGTRDFSYAECTDAVSQIMRSLAALAPERFAGIEDPLPMLMRMGEASQSGAPRFETGYQSPYRRNRIIFGAPGTGKSFRLNADKDALLANGGVFERVTFHPDYSYANFFGTYRPVATKDDDGREAISYRFSPGPFARVYAEALRNSRTAEPLPHLLIIEEINRANPAAVFGDIFQLLDRDESHASQYGISPAEDVRRYLADAIGGEPSDFSYIKIPDNMFLWATMNSADQGVFPMDTAFKRRWDFTYLGVDEAAEGLQDFEVLLGLDESRRRVSWGRLRRSINKLLSELGVNEDKQLGPFFIDHASLANEPDETIRSERFSAVFKDKVLMYLFEDAAKHYRKRLFGPVEMRYSDIVKAFDRFGLHVFDLAIVQGAGAADSELVGEAAAGGSTPEASTDLSGPDATPPVAHNLG